MTEVSNPAPDAFIKTIDLSAREGTTYKARVEAGNGRGFLTIIADAGAKSAALAIVPLTANMMGDLAHLLEEGKGKLA